MTIAENIQILLDGGYGKQANRMANSESISVEYDANIDNPTVYHFTDGSQISIEVTERGGRLTEAVRHARTHNRRDI